MGWSSIIFKLESKGEVILGQCTTSAGLAAQDVSGEWSPLPVSFLNCNWPVVSSFLLAVFFCLLFVGPSSSLLFF